MNTAQGGGLSGHVRRVSSVWESVRSHEWWEFKIPPLLATAYVTALVLHIPLWQLWPLLLLVILALLPGAAYVCVLNDITDLAEDRACGKKNRMEGKSRAFQALMLTACILPGIGMACLFRHDTVTLPLYLATWLAFTLYSVPPIRLKTRGIGGVLMDASGSHLLPTLWTCTLMAEATGHAIPMQLLATLGVWALMLGLRGILWHQLYDRDNDQRGHVATFAAGHHPQSIRRFVAWVAFPIEMTGLLLILIQSGTMWAGAMLGLYLVCEWMNYRFIDIDIILVQPTKRYRIIFAEYYQLQYPFTFLFALMQESSGVWLLIAAQIVLFPHCFRVFVTHLRFIVRQKFAPALRSRLRLLRRGNVS